MKVEVVESGAAFLAFSHVWAHGLGNPNVNGLPACQIRRLQDLANQFTDRSPPVAADVEKMNLARPTHPALEVENLEFWLDTLCIPVGDNYAEIRKLAILDLAKVFSGASKVLVLDAEVEEVSLASHPLEKEMRLITSDWMRRVWTLQEALLTRPGGLYWQFKERAMSAAEVWQGHAVRPQDISYRLSAFEKRLPAVTGISDDPSQLSENFLAVLYALRYRSLSRDEDETICLAPILGLGRRELLSTKDNLERIKVFLRLWGTIPTYFLFLEGERIEMEGCRWMPTSFVRGLHKSSATSAPVTFTKFDTSGLYVNFPGLLLSVSEHSHVHFEAGFYNPLADRYYTVKDQGLVFESKLPVEQRWRYWHRRLHQIARPAFVLEYPTDYQGGEGYVRAVLVSITKEHEGVLYARFLCRAWLDPCDLDRRLPGTSKQDVQHWFQTTYENKVRGFAVDEQAALRAEFPASPGMIGATLFDQRWCIG